MNPLLLAMVLQGGGNIMSGISQAQQQNASNKLQAQEFGQQIDLARNAQAMQAANQLNRMPMADKGQYLAMHTAAPTAFQPRDYTQGLSKLSQPATGGAADQLAANNAASANYRAGAGGVKPDTLNWILGKMGAPASAQASTQTYNYGGQQMTPQQWSDYLSKHPEMNGQGY